MNRRKFLAASSAAGLSTAAAAESSPKNSIYTLYYYYMNNTGNQVQRTTAYLRDTFAPAAKRHGIGPVGFFSPMFAERGPYILSIATYPSFAAFETVREKFAADEEFRKGWDAYNTIGDPAYVRMEVSVLRAFDKFPAPEVPPTDAQRAARVFELRTYENMNEKAGGKKDKMFEDGEAAVFKKLGMQTVFFGRTIAGRNMPSLSYMLGYDDLAARDKMWAAFGRDPEWQKLRATPGLSDAEIVSNITSVLLRPLPFSMIR
jgi:hypothetical protein